MQHIDYSFLPSEPESWFRLIFRQDHLLTNYIDEPVTDVHMVTEQVLFQYKNPWKLQIIWSSAASELLSGITSKESEEPILLEWTNILANHWACHWLRKNQSPIAPGGLPIRINEPSGDAPKWSLNISLLHKASGLEGSLQLNWFAPGNVEQETPGSVPWAFEALQFLDMLPLGAAILNQKGEVTHLNQWIKQKETYLQKKELPLPWELVFKEGFLHDIWSMYHTYKRASYCTPWLHQIEGLSGFNNGPYIVSLLPSHVGATLQLSPVPPNQIDELQKVRLDPLTKLYTRDTWIEKLQHQSQKESWLVLLGIDGFSNVNDGLGHSAGDLYLQQVAARLKYAYPNALIGRWNGDEFILAFHQSSYPDVRTIFQESFVLNEEEFYGSGCVSIVKHQPSLRLNEQIQQLEWSLRDAKALGRGKTQLHAPEQKNVREVRRQLFYIENRLRQAVALKQFFLLYQPLIRLSDKHIVGAEALIRWQHPELGIVAPQQFIPVAEQNGTIISMTSWVLNSALEFTKEWASGFQFMLSVNLSPIHFDDPAIVTDIQKLLSDSNFPPQNLKLEITEGAMLETTDSNKNILHQLREIGVTFAIDDFGTGNASLSYLKEFPVQQLKIDKSYIHALHRPQHYLLTQSIIDLAHRMNLVVVAEGVETQEQEDALIKMGCDLAQGFKYGRPMSAENLAHLLIEQDQAE